MNSDIYYSSGFKKETIQMYRCILKKNFENRIMFIHVKIIREKEKLYLAWGGMGE